MDTKDGVTTDVAKVETKLKKNLKTIAKQIDGLPPKELRKLVDKGKKDLGEGIVVVEQVNYPTFSSLTIIMF